MRLATSSEKPHEETPNTVPVNAPIPNPPPGHTGHNQFIDLTSQGPPPPEAQPSAQGNEPNTPMEPQPELDPLSPVEPEDELPRDTTPPRDDSGPIGVPVPDLENDPDLDTVNFAFGDDLDDSPEHLVLHSQEEQIYSLEIEVDHNDLKHWQRRSSNNDYSFLVGAAKKKGAEVKIKDLTIADKLISRC